MKKLSEHELSSTMAEVDTIQGNTTIFSRILMTANL